MMDILTIGGVAAALSGIIGLGALVVKSVLSSYMREADIALAQRETQRAADNLATTRRLDHVESELASQEMRVETIQAKTEANVVQLVRLETTIQTLTPVITRLADKLDELLKR